MTNSNKSFSILNLHRTSYQSTSSPPSKLQSTLRLWDECSRSFLCISPGGGHLAVTGARNTVQVVSRGQISGGHQDTDTLLSGGQRLVGHTGCVNSVYWSRTGDWLVTGGGDHVVKVWDWKSRRVILNVNTRKGGHLEENFGVVRKVSKETPVFSEPVNKSQFFYLDSLLMSVSSNKLEIHNVNLPGSGDTGGEYKLVKTITLPDCKTVTTMSCINQFYSFISLLACSDRSVRVYDVNQAKVISLV